MTIVSILLVKKTRNGKLSRGEAGYLTVLIELVETYERQNIHDAKSVTVRCLHLIEAKGATHVQVERDTGVAAPTISAVIAGRRRLTRDQIGKLTAYFHVAPTVFSFDG